MVQYDLDATFAALSDPIRRGMLQRLSRGEATVTELGGRHGMSLAGVLKHVRYLERAGLVRARKEGRTRICQLVPRPLAAATEWLAHYERFWNLQLDSLDHYLTSTDPTPTWTPPPPTSPSKSGARTRPPRRGSTLRGRRRKR